MRNLELPQLGFTIIFTKVFVIVRILWIRQAPYIVTFGKRPKVCLKEHLLSITRTYFKILTSLLTEKGERIWTIWKNWLTGLDV